MNWAFSAPRHYLNRCWLIIWLKQPWNLNQNTIIFIQENAPKIPSAGWLSFCLRLNVLMKMFSFSLVLPWERRLVALQWRHNDRDGILNYRVLHCLLNCWSRCRSKKISNFLVTDLCGGNSPVTGEFPALKASDAENVSIWWHHHGTICDHLIGTKRNSWQLSHCLHEI